MSVCVHRRARTHMCMGYAHAMVHMWNLWELVPSFYHVSSRYRAQAPRFDSKQLYILRHILVPEFSVALFGIVDVLSLIWIFFIIY